MTTLLPALDDRAQSIHRRPSKPAHRILLLDDDDDLREIYVEALFQEGYLVDAAADGQAGWEALQARKYDLLITDHEMPRLSGLELVKKVCSSRMPLAVIIASGSLSPGELKRHPSIQIAAALPKPFSPEDLLKTVQQVLCGNASAEVPPNGLRDP
jgi:DNA-binding response OmpR family regulator